MSTSTLLCSPTGGSSISCRPCPPQTLPGRTHPVWHGIVDVGNRQVGPWPWAHLSKVTGSTSFCLWALLSTVAEQWQRGRPVSDYAQAGAGTRRRGAWSVVCHVCACDECSGLTCHVGTYVLGSPRAAAQQSQTQTHAWPMGHAIHHHRRTLQARTHDCPFLFFSLSLKNKQIARLSFELLPAQRKRELNNAIIIFAWDYLQPYQMFGLELLNIL